MRDLQTRCKLMSLERKCTDGVERLRTVLETQLHSNISHADLWGKTVSFFTPKKAPIFHDGYSKYSRETLRFFPAPAEDLAPLCFQQ
uniref:Si:ch73-21g5.7 n=1 Tax=Pygocentrus nattereri TaxID=42514 RepID=A0A3B4CKV0_PYGNA